MIKPIIFSTPMVKAILDGDKTMTRRVIKPQPKCKLCYIYAGSHNGKWSYPDKNALQYWGEAFRLPEDGLSDADRDALWTPPCHGDDILWVRETWESMRVDGKDAYLYRTNDAQAERIRGYGYMIHWQPSMFMPKEAARIFLRVSKVSVERLQEISREDIVREGLATGAVSEFRKLWDGLRKPADRDKYGWAANPWVWVISFERCEKPEA